IGAETRDKLGCVALPALQLVVPSSAVTFLPRLLRKDVDGVGCAKELSDPPGRIIRAIGTFRLCAGRDDWVYCHRMRTRIALLDQARRGFRPVRIRGIVESIFTVGMELV